MIAEYLTSKHDAVYGCWLGVELSNIQAIRQSARHRITCRGSGVDTMKITVECVICHETFESDDSLLLPEHPDEKASNVTCIGSNRKGRPV